MILKQLIFFLSCTLATVSVIQSPFSVFLSHVCPIEDIEHNTAMMDKQANKELVVMLSGDNKEHKIF